MTLYALFSPKIILPLIYTIFGFGLLIIAHELGHFIFCKIFKIYTPTFSIGMGPEIFRKKIGQTNFRLALLPIGGYVEIAGLSEVGQGEQEFANLKGENSFANKPYWQKACVILGGITFNIVLAYFIFISVLFIGIPKQNTEIFVKKDFSGLKAGDKIIEINMLSVEKNIQLILSKIQEIIFDKTQREQSIKFEVKYVRNRIVQDRIIKLETAQDKDNLLESVEFKSTPIPGQYEKYPLVEAIKKGINTTHNCIINILAGIKYLVTNRTLKGAGGPILILTKTFETAQKGIIPLLIFLAIISLNLAIINLVPISVLDGGQFLFLTIEAIIRREIPEKIKTVINLASWGLILFLFLYMSYKDVLNQFFKK